MVFSDCVLTTQALSEFYSAATSKNKVSSKDAKEQIEDWITLFPVVSSNPTILVKAILDVEKHQFSFWDSILLETAIQSGVTHFYSEGMQHERLWKGMKIINPFV